MVVTEQIRRLFCIKSGKTQYGREREPTMLMKNVRIFDGQFCLRRADVLVEGDTITAVENHLPGEETLQLGDCLLAPGFVDTHIHGCAGADTCDGTVQALSVMAKTLPKFGVTSFCPTTMTIPEKEIRRALNAVRKCMAKPPEGARILGANMEGPYISPEQIGAQKKECIRTPDAERFLELYHSTGEVVRMVDIAPEQPGAEKFIHQAGQFCTVSLAHSVADYEQAQQAFTAGIRHVTHLFNAMTGLHHRKPGAVGAVLDSSDVSAELICDGFHIHPAVLRMAFRALGAQRTVIISDSMRAAGLGDGTFDLGGQDVFVQGGHALLKDGTIAGSTTNLAQEVQNLYSFGVPLEQIIRSATSNPAREIGMGNCVGSIEVGKKADFTVLDQNLHVVMTIVGGRIVYQA
jgi:N-acetylglucosamine-6-phosphate deacetylase